MLAANLSLLEEWIQHAKDSKEPLQLSYKIEEEIYEMELETELEDAVLVTVSFPKAVPLLENAARALLEDVRQKLKGTMAFSFKQEAAQVSAVAMIPRSDFGEDFIRFGCLCHSLAQMFEHVVQTGHWNQRVLTLGVVAKVEGTTFH